MRDIVVMGAGGLAREVMALLADLNRQRAVWNLVGFIERDESLTGRSVGQSVVLGSAAWLRRRQCETNVVFAIGTPEAITRAHSEIADLPWLRYPNLVHPTVTMDRDRVSIGEGNVVCAGNILTTDIAIGSYNVLNP